MIRSAVTISLVPEAHGGPFVYWDGLEAGCAQAAALGFDAVEVFPRSAQELDARRLNQLLASTASSWPRWAPAPAGLSTNSA